MATIPFGSVEAFPASDFEALLTPSEDGTNSKKKTNALSTKLTSVLSSSYADSDIRNAIRLLDAREVDKGYYLKKNLKANAQKEVIDHNAAIVDDFGKVAEQLKRVGLLVNTLNQTCDDLQKHIVAARQESGPVLEEATILLSRKRESESKQQLLETFCKHFLISDEDLTMLTSSAEPVSERFFGVLNRVKQINRDCEILLGYENQRLGLELMEQTRRDLDAGFKKLYNWIQREFKALDLEDPHISGSIRRALRVLSEKPTLFQNCLDFFADARETTLSEAFSSALTGSSGGSAKAIDFSTHDPLRYIGDMLAWVHSAGVSEREALEGLFISDASEISKGLTTGKNSEPWARVMKGSPNEDDMIPDSADENVVFDGQKALSELVSRNLAAVSQILQFRIESAVRNSGEPVLMYKAYNLLDFYRGIFLKLVGPESTITKTVINLESFSLVQFEDVMEEETATVTSDNIPSTDLSPPSILASTLKQFSDIARARGSQMSLEELQRVFATMLSRIFDACAEGATKIPDVRQSSIYKLNYLTALETTLNQIIKYVPCANVPLEKSSTEMRSLRDRLIEYLTTTFLEDSGVNDLLQGIDSLPVQDGQSPAARYDWLQSNLDTAAQQLDAFLSSALMDAQESFNLLANRNLAKEIVTDAVERFCVEFDELEVLLDVTQDAVPNNETAVAADEGVDDEDERVQRMDLRDLYPRTNAEVRALLS